MTRPKRHADPRHRPKKRLPHRAAPAGRGGRPSQAEAQRLGERILDVATDLFLSHGYGPTSIEAIARRARISKRTFYHRFEDKPALFVAVVHRIVDRLRPPPDMPLLEGSIREVLERLARLILRAALTPQAVALMRMIIGESARFPKLAALVTAKGVTGEAIRFIAELLEREARAGNLALDDAIFAAQQFLFMVIAVPQRRAMGLGEPMTPAEIDAWPRDVVALFLEGCRSRVRGAE
jgi:AcrR family transcriptional regulator